MRTKILELDAAKDHWREAGDASLADAMEAAPARNAKEVTDDLRRLCAELRARIDELAPHAAAEAAHGKLDELETGLFGAAAR